MKYRATRGIKFVSLKTLYLQNCVPLTFHRVFRTQIYTISVPVISLQIPHGSFFPERIFLVDAVKKYWWQENGAISMGIMTNKNPRKKNRGISSSFVLFG